MAGFRNHQSSLYGHSGTEGTAAEPFVSLVFLSICQETVASQGPGLSLGAVMVKYHGLGFLKCKVCIFAFLKAGKPQVHTVQYLVRDPVPASQTAILYPHMPERTYRFSEVFFPSLILFLSGQPSIIPCQHLIMDLRKQQPSLGLDAFYDSVSPLGIFQRGFLIPVFQISLLLNKCWASLL